MTLTHTLAVIQVADIGEHGMILSNEDDEDDEDEKHTEKHSFLGAFFIFSVKNCQII